MKTKILIITICALFFCIAGSELLFAQSKITYDPGTILEVSSGADICADAIIINGMYSGVGTICSGPLPITMQSFTVQAVLKNNAKLQWTTAVELNNSGFDIERKTIKEGDVWKKITFIPGSGTTTEPKSYTFEDKKLQTGTYKYRLKQIDYNGNYEYFNAGNDVVIKAPNDFSLSQNYPNPSNPKSRIEYQIPFTGKVSIKIYDLLGKEVISLVDETKEAGYYTAEFDGSNLASGVYFYRIIADGSAQRLSKTLKMILVK